MPPDKAADILGDMPGEKSEKLLSRVGKDDRYQSPRAESSTKTRKTVKTGRLFGLFHSVEKP
ncbi:MAG TPA: hypothetical protein DCZ04_16595 [Syntrophorhabdus aromaticivorans]|nr:hypothetical protein [Syntrophorhabdus aromaticivorans]